MNWIEIVFWISVFLVFYTYAGYGILVWTILKIKNLFNPTLKNLPPSYFAPVTLVIPAFNEEDFIREKISNTLSLQYPPDLLEVIFITDGSSDRTPEIISEYSEIFLMHSPQRKGKIAAMNRAMKQISTPFVVFCDANTMLNPTALQEIMKHYSDPKVGGVAGEKKVMSSEGDSAGKGESLYWKYESALKQLDSDLYTVVGAAGELFSFRTELFEEIEEDTLLDDFVISLNICLKGYRVAYEPQAYAMENPSANIKEEQKRKVRISAGAFQSLFRLKSLFNVFKHPVLSFQYISHRVLRWALCPFLLPLILILNIIILRYNDSLFYKIFLFCQVLFYLLSFIGWYLTHNNRKAGIFNFPYYFLFMNFSLYLGLARYMKGNQTVIWEKAKRAV